ncbi:hypothetical protein ANN_00271 [Periplaneta americana]|uniref:Protein phosphatase 1 regulatory subunit 16A n=1 Tax=Periplaneta americana TaxID=6978 RepID=A0ABQ8TT75_PERAM|nr:hypothetical protein ANN_00271 [Periplaneta americana]
MKGVSPDSTNEDGLTALHQCCIDDNEEMMKLLIEYGANVNAEDSEKWTPLHAAATCGHLHLVRYLISRGSNLLAVNADGNMPYDICEDEAALDYIEGEMARRGVTQELIDETRAATELQMLRDLHQLAAEGGDLETYDHQGATPLHIAAANGYLRVVEFLLDHNVATNVKDNDDWQPVHAAACWGHVLNMIVVRTTLMYVRVMFTLTLLKLEVLELLVHHGADLNAKTKHDETPADICEDPELRERIIQLRSEQETKRLQETKNKRVNRSQSNTRTQSVRRTSIRDKTIITKKDAVEEARRLAQEVFVAPGESGNNNNSRVEPPPLENIPPVEHVPSSKETANGDVVGSDLVVSTERRAPEGQDNIIDEEFHNDSKAAALGLPTSYVTGGNGNINIHVSVTINAGTLADLKKQRSQIRNNSPDGMAAGLSPISSVTSSPTPVVQRFTGDTDDVVGDPRPKRCCVVS